MSGRLVESSAAQPECGQIGECKGDGEGASSAEGGAGFKRQRIGQVRARAAMSESREWKASGAKDKERKREREKERKRGNLDEPLGLNCDDVPHVLFGGRHKLVIDHLCGAVEVGFVRQGGMEREEGRGLSGREGGDGGTGRGQGPRTGT